MSSPDSFFNFANLVSRRLLTWSVLSVGIGSWLRSRRRDLPRGAGIQFVTWGLIDAAIALFGLANNFKKGRSQQATEPDFVANEAGNLRKALWINGGLDVLYVLGGVWAFRTGEQKNDRAKWRGHGLGVIIQGGFLLVFDVWHALLMRKFS